MRMLAIECATEACSLALFEGETLLDSRHEILGRGHAEHLVPLIASLPDKGRAAEIRVSLGPGSFTGVRIGLAAARALGIAWDAEVRGYPTLALVAAAAQEECAEPVSICMAGGHGEWFVQHFGTDGQPEGPALSATPQTAAAGRIHALVAGNRARELTALTGSEQAPLAQLPDARFSLHLADRLLRDDLAPIYGRPPDAMRPT